MTEAGATSVKDQTYYNLVAGVLALGVVTMLVAWTGMTVSAGANASGASGTSAGPAHMYLTVQVNPNSGEPQYSPANFTVPLGEVVFTIYDFDSAVSWGGCMCNVTGTLGNSETVNGTPTSDVSYTNAAHTFTITQLGLNVVSPGNSTVVFTVDFTSPGTYTWVCLDPCGADGYTGEPMGVPGYMSGTVTVA